MKKNMLSVAVISVLMFVASIVVAVPASAEDLTWVGCGISKKAFMSALASEYEKKTGVHIDLQGGGATRGIRDVASGKADIGGSCRHVLRNPEEKNANLEHVAWDALVVITNPDNPVSDINISDLKAVFEGGITNWKDLGGPDMPIKVVARKGNTSGVGLMARELLFKDPQKEFTSRAVYLKSSGPLEKMIEKERGAIGISGVSSAKKSDVKMLSINGKTPTHENIASGAYILYRPLYLVTSRTPSEKVRSFIRFAKSEEGQAIISDQGTVNLKDGSALWQPYNNSMKQVRGK